MADKNRCAFCGEPVPNESAFLMMLTKVGGFPIRMSGVEGFAHRICESCLGLALEAVGYRFDAEEYRRVVKARKGER